MTTTTTDIVIVRDGQYRWGADRKALIAAMQEQGWTKKGRNWVEPECPADDETGEDDLSSSAYTILCQSIKPLPGYDVTDSFDADGLSSLTWEPEYRAWVESRP